MKLIEDKIFEFVQKKSLKNAANPIGAQANFTDEIKQWITKYTFIGNVKPLMQKGQLELVILSDMVLLNPLEYKEFLLPEFIKFNLIKGDFIFDSSYIINLNGFPKIVEGDFYLNAPKLKSLEFCPEEVKGDFILRTEDYSYSIEDIKNVCNVHGNIYI